MARYKLGEADAELSSNFFNGETWRVTAGADGVIDCKDADIDAELAKLAADQSHPLQLVKSKG